MTSVPIAASKLPSSTGRFCASSWKTSMEAEAEPARSIARRANRGVRLDRDDARRRWIVGKVQPRTGADLEDIAAEIADQCLPSRRKTAPFDKGKGEVVQPAFTRRSG